MKIDSKLLRKEACPQCKANGYDWDGNGLGIYDDGHTYCFKCKTYSNEVKNLLNMYDEKGGEEGWSSKAMNKSTNQETVKQPAHKEVYDSKEFIGKYGDISHRGITLETCEKLDIMLGEIYSKPAYGYQYDKGYKVYFYEESPKKFNWIDGSERDSGPFGLDKFDDFDKPIIITEGELDAAACVEAGYQACSIKSGNGSFRQSFQGIHKDKLLKFKEIWLGFDNDDAGQVPKNHALEDLPADKVKLIDWGKFKDANEALMESKETLTIILATQVQEWRPEGVIFGDEVDWDAIWTPRPEGLGLPWKGLQDMIKGLHKGRLYLFGGGASIGKSSVLRELAYYLRTTNPDLKMAHLFLEEDSEAGPLTYLSIHENIPLGEILENKDLIPQKKRKELQTLLNKNTMFTNEQYELGSEDLLKQLEWLATVKNYDIIILDHISMVAEASNSKESERICINQLMLKLRSLVRRTGLTVLAACHLSNPSMGKDWEEGREVQQKDFHGSSALRKVPDVMIGVERNMRDPYNCDKLVLRVIKNRWFSKLGVSDTLVYFTKTGRLK